MIATNMDLKDRVFLITGGTSGVGKATANGLAKLGAKIVIVSRSAERGQDALNSIAQATGNDRGEYLVADLSLQSSVKALTEEVKRKYDNLHVLANLAGAIYFEKQLTSEGIERMFAINYLNQFFLTTQLLDMLKESRPARVITVLGNPRFLGNPKINFEDLQSTKKFSGMAALGQGMFARAFFALELARRLEGTGVTSVSFHPGNVKSNLLKTTSNVPWLIKIVTPIFDALAKDTCDIGVYLAAAKEIEQVSAVFFDDKKKIVPIYEKYDEAVGRKLWRASEELTSISAAQP
jgi:NAD(P)-dependent dehydrogenase (short-subunit alcohol dehydrogenase family)